MADRDASLAPPSGSDPDDETHRAILAALRQPTPVADLITGDTGKDAWLKDVLDGRISMGRPAAPQRTGRPGRPKKPKEFHEARDRRMHVRKVVGTLKRQQHRGNTFPKARLGKTKAALDPKFAQIVRDVVADRRIPKHRRVSEVGKRCARRSVVCPSIPTVRQEIIRVLADK